MTQGFGGFLLLLGGGCGEVADCRAGAGPGFICVIFCLQITDIRTHSHAWEKFYNLLTTAFGHWQKIIKTVLNHV